VSLLNKVLKKQAREAGIYYAELAAAYLKLSEAIDGVDCEARCKQLTIDIVELEGRLINKLMRTEGADPVVVKGAVEGITQGLKVLVKQFVSPKEPA
jgi:hypothetical protein